MRTSHWLRTTLLGLVIVSQAGCKKKDEDKMPSAEFITDKSEYVSGEVIRLLNKSTDAKTYRWTFPDGTTGKSVDANWPTIAASAGVLQFKLEAISTTGLKSDYTVKNVIVRQPVLLGKVIFYKISGGAGSYILTINNKTSEIYFPFTQNAPECGAPEFPTFELNVGLYPFVIQSSNGFAMQSGTIEIKHNQCSKFRVTL